MPSNRRGNAHSGAGWKRKRGRQESNRADYVAITAAVIYEKLTGGSPVAAFTALAMKPASPMAVSTIFW